MNWVLKALGGRTTAFATAYLVCGIVLAFQGKLTSLYLGLATPVLAMLGKSIHDGYHERAMTAMGKGPEDVQPSGS